jgi:DNA-binding MarR family transcriptional regulator
MTSNKHGHKTAIFEDGTHAVLRFDPAEPRRMELVAIFYEAAHAQDYVRLHAPAEVQQQKMEHVVKQPAKSAPKPSSAAKKAKTKPLPSATPRPASEAKPARAAQHHKPAKSAHAPDATTGMTDRQTAVLKALRSRMDKKHRVEAKAAELAKASSVPLGSLHSILASLEKKRMIRTERQGSPKFPAVYEVLDTSRKAMGALNGAIGGKAAPAQASR